MVNNSRRHKSDASTWRRRECQSCHAVISTEELPLLDNSLMVKSETEQLSRFQRDELFLSIYGAVKHRPKAIGEAGELTRNVIALLLKPPASARIDNQHIAKTAYTVLKRFDKLAGELYLATHNLA